MGQGSSWEDNRSSYNQEILRIQSSCLYRASMTIKTLYYPTDAQIYNSHIQLELL